MMMKIVRVKMKLSNSIDEKLLAVCANKPHTQSRREKNQYFPKKFASTSHINANENFSFALF